ncbi:MAG TPA: SAM-dependent methyltransferase, partial [bacterium]|nr:SAM-dependent methyltransferase [bacterium]
REFLQAQGKFFDLIDIPPLDSFSAASAGVYALNESYLYTTEALGIYLNHLMPQGILSITRWIKTPPRDELKLFATMTVAAERKGIREPQNHIAVIRSWNTVTLLLSRSPWSETQIQSLRVFLSERGFDAVYFPGMRPEERNRFVILDDPVYDPMIPGLLGSDRKRFYRDYLFDIRPATDDRPYFFHFFKWQSLPRLLKGMGTEWVPFVEWGYLTLLATFFQALPASLLIVLAPLFFRKPDEPMSSLPVFPVFFYFSGIGFGYMFLEIAFIQKFMLFLAYPIYAVAVVLTSFLIFSGAGSYFADCYKGRKRVLVIRAVCFLAVLSAVYLAVLPKVFEFWIGWPRELKTVASIFLLAPLAFWMGVPFPCGMQTLSDRSQACVPWAWAINGCASVLGAILAALVAVHAGFGTVVFLAAGMYALALAGFLFLDQLKTP